jgi:N-acetylglucosamine kinase-like BadF-type ATPase
MRFIMENLSSRKTSPSLVIGVDGGGTKTVAWLAPLGDTSNAILLGRGQAGPGNPRAAGFDVAQANIAAAIVAAFVDAGLPRGAVAAACFGLAGAGRDIEQQRLAAWATDRGIARAVRVTGDAEPILAAASSDNCGVALICGTGSLAWGRSRDGEIGRTGGWGYLLGDEGSAYAIARAGLTAVMQAVDGRGPATVLLQRFQEELQATNSAELIDRIYGPEMTRERLAALATVVFAAADSDQAAQGIVGAAADDLAKMVAVLCRRLALAAKEYTLALAGSVILNQSRLRSFLRARLEQHACSPREMQLVYEPVRGAVALARVVAQTN